MGVFELTLRPLIKVKVDRSNRDGADVGDEDVDVTHQESVNHPDEAINETRDCETHIHCLRVASA